MKQTIPFKRLVVFLIITLVSGVVIHLANHGNVSSRNNIATPKAGDDRLNLSDNQRMGEIIGSVISESGRPLTTVTVCVAGRDNLNTGDVTCTQTDTAGTYHLSVYPGSYLVSATAVGHESSNTLLEVASNSINSADFNLQKVDTSIIGVTRSATGDVIPNARILLTYDQNQLATANSDANGRFVASIPDGPVAIKAEAEGFAHSVIHTVAPSRDISITMFPGFVINGQVLDESRGPISGVRVVASLEEKKLLPADNFSTVTNNEGRFVIEGLEVGNYTVYLKDPSWYAESQPTASVDMRRPAQEVSIAAKRGSSFHGILSLTSKGEPCRLGYVAVQRFGVDVKAETFLTIKADNQGVVKSSALPLGTYSITARCQEATWTAGPSRVELVDSAIEGLEWSFSRGNTLTAIVKDGNGSAVPEAILSLTPSSLIADKEESIRPVIANKHGTYQFGSLNAGYYQLTARMPGISGLAPVHKEVEIIDGAAEKTVEVIVPASGQILISSMYTNNDINSQTLFFAEDQEKTRYEARYQGEGQYQIGPLLPGAYWVFAYDNLNPKIPLLYQDKQSIEIDARETVKLQYIAKDLTAKITGRVFSGNGFPASNCGVRVVSDSLTANDEFFSVVQRFSHGNRSVLTDKEGYFTQHDIAEAGSYTIHVTCPDSHQGTYVGAFANEHVEINLAQLVSVSGSVLDNMGSPVRSFLVEISDIHSQGPPIIHEFNSDEGMFEFSNVPQGEKVITITEPRQDRRSERFVSLNANTDNLMFYLQ